MQNITTEWVSIDVSDGTKMEVYVARPAGDGPHPGLLVLQEIFGVNAHIRDIVERFAREGYVAAAPDLFHRFAPRHEGTYDAIPASIALAGHLTPEGAMADLQATFGHLQTAKATSGQKIGSIGYCMGGRLSFVANAILPLAAAVSYYGGGTQQHLDLAEKLSGPMLFFWAGKDVYIPVDVHHAIVDSLRKAGKPFVDAELSDVDHGFFCDARGNHSAAASAQAWALTVAFLASHLRGG